MYIPSTTTLSFFLALLLHFTVVCQKKDVTIPILIPYSSRYTASVNTALATLRTEINTLDPTKYRPKIDPLFLRANSPDEILQHFTNKLMNGDVNCVVYIQYKDDDTAKAAAEYTMSILGDLGIPVLSWDPNYAGSLEKTKEQNILQLAPTVYHNGEAMLELMDFYNWTHFTIITTTQTNYFDFIGSVKESVVKRNVEKVKHLRPEFKLLETVLCDLREGTDQDKQRALIESCLKKKVPRENRIFLLHTESRFARTFLEAASNLHIRTKEHQWILTSTSVGLITDSLGTYPLGVLGLTYRATLTYDYKSVEKAIVDSVRIWIRMMTQVAGNSTFNIFPDFINSAKWTEGQYIYRELLHTDIVTHTLNNSKSLVEFTEYGLNKYSELQIVNTQLKTLKYGTFPSWQEVGKWVPQVTVLGRNVKIVNKVELSSITWPGNQPFPPLGRPARRFFNIATLQEEPYVMYRNRDSTTGKCIYPAAECRVMYNATAHGNDTTYENGTVIMCCTGLSIDLLRILSDRMKFDYSLFEVPDKIFGIQDQNGDWNGLIKLIQDKGADMAITSLQITPRRNQAIKFSMPYLETGTTIVVSLTKGAISATAVLEPYDYPAWCLILVFSVHSIGASIFIFEWLSPSGLDQGKTPLREHKFSLFRSFWLIWAMLFGAAVSTDNPRGVSSRFLGNVWALFALVFLASYTANLAAFMITKETYYDLSGIQDWRLTNPYKHKPRPFKFATVPNGSTEENLRETRPTMYKYMSQYNQLTVKAAIAALKNQEINAFIYDATPLEYQVGIDPLCNLRTVGQAYAMTGYGVGFPPDTDDELITEVNKIILDLQDDGELGRLRKFWLAGACHSKLSRKQSSDELGIKNFTSAFILLAAGILLGYILLMLEHLYFRFGRKCLKEYDKCGCCALVSLSMGKSLTFEQTIMEAIDLHKRHRCKDPLCETQLWKAKHELDLALLKILKLNREIGYFKDMRGKRIPAIKNKPENVEQQDSKFIDETKHDKSGTSETVNGQTHQRRKDPTLKRCPSYTTAISDGDTTNDLSTNTNSNDFHSNNVKEAFSLDTTALKEPHTSRNNEHEHLFGDGEV